MIVTVPEFGGSTFSGTNVDCQVVVNSGGKMSDPQPFIYKPGKILNLYTAVT